ncbi:T9SS type A sorting domain-containing protein [Emticicia sp. 17c]|uniref:T9SS type A sorting domain-containing protein n=1 Tax=Emticicia sp. 17c TaxID=3127704 RepID=UPI00301CB5E5
MKRLWPFIFLLLSLGQSENLFAQWHCGTPSPSEKERETLLAQYQSFLQQQSNHKARVTNYKVAVRVNVIAGTSTPETAILNETEIRDIISHANTYLQPINVELYLLDNQVYSIRDDKYFEFKITDEAELRKKYDVNNAINIYFARNISMADLTVLAGYSSLPSASASSNRIFYSYFEHSPEDVQNIRNRTFLHELGHYFGLLHTFQDSKNTNLLKRELVTRGVGSNCSTMGDQLCDTPADPFELLPIEAAFKCSNTSPTTIVDANGEPFTPPVDNIMSYYQGCGNVFTPQQYQKMQASFAVRFSPSVEYQIAAQGSTNFLTIKSLSKDIYCAGDSMQVVYGLDGVFEDNNQINVELSDSSGQNYQSITASRRGNRIYLKLPETLLAGDNYHIRLTATRPETTSPISEGFSVRAYPSASLTSNTLNTIAGESINLTLRLQGSGPWSFNLSDSTAIKDSRQDTFQFTKILTETTMFSVLSLRNVCGEGSKTEPITINVAQPQIRLSNLPSTTICQGQTVRFSISISGGLTFDSQLVMQISDPIGNSYIDLPTQVSLFNISAQIPSDLPMGSGYKIKVITRKSQLFSAAIGPITVIAPPAPPAISSVINLCQNSALQVLKAGGTNLKWYEAEYDLTYYNTITPPTQKEGTFTYYVTQTNGFGCESNRAKVEVNIRPTPAATLTGDNTILSGDSTSLNVAITGDFPVTLTMSDGNVYNAGANPFKVGVKPSKTTTYSLREVKNICGTGMASGTARITIMEPLAKEENLNQAVSVYPNPASQQLTLELLTPQIYTPVVSVTDMTGKVLQENALMSTQQTIDLSHYSAGNYILRIRLGDKYINRKITIQK